MAPRILAAEHFDENELNKLLKYLHQNQLWTYYILVRLGVSTALRYSDLSKIAWADILDQKSLVLRGKKTSKIRSIPLHPDLVEILTKVYVKMGTPQKSTAVIPITIRTVNKQLKLYAAKAGIRGKRISSHTLRKTFGRLTWERNNYSEASLIKLSQLFNHSSTSITRIYLSITKEEVEDLYNLQDIFTY
jgi:integrase